MGQSAHPSQIVNPYDFIPRRPNPGPTPLEKEEEEDLEAQNEKVDDWRRHSVASHGQQQGPQWFHNDPAQPPHHGEPANLGGSGNRGVSGNRVAFGTGAGGRPGSGRRIGNRGGVKNRTHADDLHKLEFPQLAAEVGVEHLVVKDGIYLSTLQRMVMLHLQKDLTMVVARIHQERRASRRDMERANKLLTEYTTAIRNYDFMTEAHDRTMKLNEPDPFHISSNRTLGRWLIRKAMLNPDPRPGHHHEYAHHASDRLDYDQGRKNILPGVSRMEHSELMKRTDITDRLIFGVAGGLTLLVPMLIMVLHKDLMTALLTTGITTLSLAIVLGIFGSGLNGAAVMTIVAGYAAVWVVFVGLIFESVDSDKAG